MYTQTGNYAAAVGMVVVLFSKFFPNLSITTSDVTAVIGGIVAIVGVIQQYRAHRDLAIAGGFHS